MPVRSFLALSLFIGAIAAGGSHALAQRALPDRAVWHDPAFSRQVEARNRAIRRRAVNQRRAVTPQRRASQHLVPRRSYNLRTRTYSAPIPGRYANPYGRGRVQAETAQETGVPRYATTRPPAYRTRTARQPAYRTRAPRQPVTRYAAPRREATHTQRARTGYVRPYQIRSANPYDGPVYAPQNPRRAQAARLPQSRRPAPATTPRARVAGANRTVNVSYPPGYDRVPTPLFSRASLEATMRAAARYRLIVRSGGWRRIPPGKGLRMGDAGNRVVLLKYRLIKTGDYPRPASITTVFDQRTRQALLRFQARHGLAADGTAGAATLRALNVSAAERLATLEKNLARLRGKLAARLPGRFVMVNIPDYRAEVVERGRVRARHNVVVGRPSRQTNIIRAEITEVNFYPSWHVPQSIVEKDLLPRLRRGQNALDHMKLQVMRSWDGPKLNPASINWNTRAASNLKFKQGPGPNNALGMVRLNMPNRHAIYMHDTPAQSLLDRRTRAFSSGCVRVKDVFKLTNWLLRDNPGWNADRVRATLRTGRSDNVKLAAPVPVYFGYFTAWAQPGGAVQFRPDIYGHDRQLKVAERRKR